MWTRGLPCSFPARRAPPTPAHICRSEAWGHFEGRQQGALTRGGPGSTWRELGGAVPGRWRQRWDLQVAGDRAGGCHPMKAGEDSVELAQKGELVIFPVGRGPGVLCKRRTQDRPVLRALRGLSLLRQNRGFGWVGPPQAPPGREALGAVALLGPLPRTPHGRARALASALSAALLWFSGSPVTATGVWCVRPRPPALSGLSLSLLLPGVRSQRTDRVQSREGRWLWEKGRPGAGRRHRVAGWAFPFQPLGFRSCCEEVCPRVSGPSLCLFPQAPRGPL